MPAIDIKRQAEPHAGICFDLGWTILSLSSWCIRVDHHTPSMPCELELNLETDCKWRQLIRIMHQTARSTWTQEIQCMTASQQTKKSGISAIQKILRSSQPKVRKPFLFFASNSTRGIFCQSRKGSRKDLNVNLEKKQDLFHIW